MLNLLTKYSLTQWTRDKWEAKFIDNASTQLVSAKQRNILQYSQF